MLELVEPFVELTKQMRTRQDALGVLTKVCTAFGFRAGVMMEYAPDLGSLVDFLDTDEARRSNWARAPNPESMRRSIAASRALIELGQLVQFEASRFAADDPHRKRVEQLDLLDGVSVPIAQSSGVAGAIHFSGVTVLNDGQKSALHIICYLLFVSFRNLQSSEPAPMQASLTPREKEVMIQSSLGLTSPQIAELLGMAERTVNQHIENVAYKFGTRNRLHSVANLLRLNLLD